MRRAGSFVVLAVSSAVALVITSGAVALAAKPDTWKIVEAGEAYVIPAGELCDFAVEETLVGHVRLMVRYDRDGEIRSFTANPSFRVTLSANGKTIHTSDRGMDRTTITDEGLFHVHGTGIHFRDREHDFVQIGLWELQFDEAFEELISADYHGTFDGGVETAVDHICTTLAP